MRTMKITPSYNEFLGKFMCQYEVRIGTSTLQTGGHGSTPEQARRQGVFQMRGLMKRHRAQLRDRLPSGGWWPGMVI